MLATGDARWASSGAPLVRNFPRDFRALRSPRTGRPIAIGLSKGSAIIEECTQAICAGERFSARRGSAAPAVCESRAPSVLRP
jgi:hypothetical protein